jgi:glycerophosphoryl diester phosphodiesterase
MLVLSHRGYHQQFPENTLDAFRAALKLGVDGIETDLRLTADGVPVLIHDHLTRGGLEIASLTHAELNGALGFQIPTLAQALELPVPDEDRFLWNLEIKTPAVVEPTLKLVDDHHLRRQILMTSFWHPVIDDISRRVDVDCGLLMGHHPLSMPERPAWIPNHPRVNTLVWCWEFADAELIRQSAACGYRNFVYGLTTPAEHAEAATWELAGVITDRPEFVPRNAERSEE